MGESCLVVICPGPSLCRMSLCRCHYLAQPGRTLIHGRTSGTKILTHKCEKGEGAGTAGFRTTLAALPNPCRNVPSYTSIASFIDCWRCSRLADGVYVMKSLPQRC
jgi:hypothetical protein